MQNLGKIALGGLAGAALALAVVWLFGPAPVAPVVPPDVGGADPVRTVPERSAAGSVTAQLGRIQDELVQLRVAVGALDQKLRSLAETSTRLPAGAPVPTLDEDALVRAMERAATQQERAKLAELADGELLQKSQELFNARDNAGARRLLDALLTRPVTAEVRALAQIQLGMLQREGQDNAAAEATLRQVVDAHGIGTDLGSRAAYQLIWTLNGTGQREQWERALHLADTLTRSGTSDHRLGARNAAVILSHRLGDLARARADFDALVRDCGGEARHRVMLENLKQLLETRR